MIIRNDTREIPNKAFTHGATFHSDDVFSAALLKTLNPDIVIERGFSIPENYDGLVFDIGMGEFDHHQIDNEVRENGVPYASFGKLWQAFGNRLVGPEGVEHIDKALAQVIDETDNTGKPNPLSMIISSMNPSWSDEVRDYDGRFAEAVNMAQSMLGNEIKKERDLELAKRIAEKALEKASCEQIVILKKYAPVAQYLAATNVEFMISPSDRGGYTVQAIPGVDTGTTPKHPFPASWAGKNNDLSEITNIDGMTFCHSGRWICAADTLEDAVKAAVVAMCDQERYLPEMDQILNIVMPDNEHELSQENELIQEDDEITRDP